MGQGLFQEKIMVVDGLEGKTGVRKLSQKTTALVYTAIMTGLN